ncbi:MAG: hypothetical protein IJT77_00885 [Clostridia bacterium]|nr:hypothetical protein [Clostridia bacterium]
MEMSVAGGWVCVPEWTAEDARTRIVLYRKVLQLAAPSESFPVRITACSRYRLCVNGQWIGHGPARGDSQVWFADEYDLAAYLHMGANIIAVSVLCPPMDPSVGSHSLFRFGFPMLYTEGLGIDGWKCRIDRNTVFPPEETRFAPLQIHEVSAPESDQIGWYLDGYEDRTWANAVPCAPDELPAALRQLCARDIPLPEYRQHAFELPVRSVGPRQTVSFTLDAGEEMCAFPALGLSGGKGARVELLYSECYVLEDGKGNRLDSVHGHLTGYRDVYSVAGTADEVYMPYDFRTFRFLQVTVSTADAPLMLRFLNYTETGYPLVARTHGETSDPTLAPVWDISMRTLRRCMHETYVDCPFYERLQYIMDTRSQILYTYAVSADDRLARRAIDDFCRAQRPDGLLNCSYPNVNTNVIPGFSMYFILIVHDHMMYFGDPELVRRALPVIVRALDFFECRRTADGLVARIGSRIGDGPFWSFIDWAEPWMPTDGMPDAGIHGPVTMESLLYLLGLQRAAELCEYVGDDRAEMLRHRARSLSEAIRTHCMSQDGILTDGPGRPERSQHAQVFGTLTGVLSQEEARHALMRSMDEPGFAQCTVAMTFYLFRALEQTGLYDRTAGRWDVWREMVRNGCTTCVEAEHYARSECHAGGALLLYELPAAFLGVRPIAPGYARIAVSPQAGHLTWASGTVHTPRGDIRVSWHRDGEGIITEVSCDDALKADIVTISEQKKQNIDI